ncbi:MAG TPA: hypothetical protein VHH53_10885 [Pseudonocardiaceae bacterium]|nr:hypothetical protein [Pseudonocardiaceae bacterium]
MASWIEARLLALPIPLAIFGPRDEGELEIVSGIAGASHSFAAHG